MKCPSCHYEVSKTASRCPACGAEIRSLSESKSPAEPRNETAQSLLFPYKEETNIRIGLYGSESEEAAPAPAPADSNGDELAQPSTHTYGAKLFQDKKDCCVSILSQVGDRVGAGTGFFLKDGLIATNAHVIAGNPGKPAPKIIVEHMGKQYVGRVLRADFEEDVALLDLPLGKPDHVEDYENELGEPRDLLPGDQVFSVGNSRGWGLTYNQFVIKDVTKKQDFLSFREVILMNGTCQPGNSGGPIYNVHGQVVGLLTFSPVTTQQIALLVPNSKALNLYMAAAEPGVCGAVTIHTFMSLLKGGIY